MKRFLLTLCTLISTVLSFAQTELLTNGGFETWNGDVPAEWHSQRAYSNAVVSASTVAYGGSKAVQMANSSTSNRRIASDVLNLKAGTYTFSAYVKALEGEAATRLGYAIVEAQADGTYKTSGGSAYKWGNNKNGFDGPDTISTEWQKQTYTFTLEATTQLSLCVMHSKNFASATILIDDASLTTTDGGISTEEVETPEPPVVTDVEHISIAEFLQKADVNTTYELTGTVTSISNTIYGNLYIEEDGASIYVYGVLDEKGQKQNFSSLNVAVGDLLTIQGKYSVYKDVPEMEYAQFIKVAKDVLVPSTMYNLIFMVDEDPYHTATLQANDEITLPMAPTKDGYTFKGWEGLPEDMLMPSNNLTVTAIFEENVLNSQNLAITIGNPVEAFATESWYLLYQRRGGNGYAHYENATTRFYKRAVTFGGDPLTDGMKVSEASNWLVHFIPSDISGLYLIQFANGAYWQAAGTSDGSSINPTTDKSDATRWSIYRINGNGVDSAGKPVYGINIGSTAGARLDNNGNGGTLAIWGSGRVTDVDSNAAWSIVSVELEELEELQSVLIDLHTIYNNYSQYEFVTGTEPNQYGQAQVDAFREALYVANEAIEHGGNSLCAEDIVKLGQDIKDAYDAVLNSRVSYAATVKPGYYYIKSALDFVSTATTNNGNTVTHHTKAMYASDNNGKWAELNETSRRDAKYIWRITEAGNKKYHLIHASTGAQLNAITTSSNITLSTSSDSLVVFDKSGIENVYNIRLASQVERGYDYVHCSGHNDGNGEQGNLVGWSNTVDDGEPHASEWLFEEINESVALSIINPMLAQLVASNTADATLTFTNTGTYEWAWDASGQRLMSTNKGIDSSTSQTTITINTSKLTDFSFDYAVSSESNYDKLTITLDGTTLVNAISGTSSSSKTSLLTPGTHTMVVTYVKDSSQHSNDDRAYVSNFRLGEIKSESVTLSLDVDVRLAGGDDVVIDANLLTEEMVRESLMSIEAFRTFSLVEVQGVAAQYNEDNRVWGVVSSSSQAGTFLNLKVRNGEAYAAFSRNVNKSITVRYVNQNLGMVIPVTINLKNKSLLTIPVVRITEADKSSNWFAHNSTMMGYDEVHSHLIEGTLGSSMWVNRLDASLWRLGSTPASLYEVIRQKTSIENLLVQYKFVSPTVTQVKCATLRDSYNQPIVATLEVSEDGTQLTARSSVFQKTVIATLNPNNCEIEYMQNDVAGEVLNWAGPNELGNGETLTARVGISASAGDPIGNLTVYGGEFDVKFLRPLSFSSNQPEVIDAIPGVYDVEAQLSFTDWRGWDPEWFAQGTNGKDFAEFYGLRSIKMDESIPIMTDYASSGRFVAMNETLRNYFEFAVDEDSPIDIDEDYKAHVIVKYIKHAGEVASQFQARIPVILEYAWGKLSSEIVVTVKPMPIVKSTLTFQVDGETYSQSTVSKGATISLPEPPIKDGYTFKGWDGLPEDMQMPGNDLTVTAIFEIILGDVNGDNEIDVADLSAIASYILGHPSESFVEMAADVNKDNEIDVADISALAYLILHPETAQKAKARKVAEKKENIENAYNTLYAEMLQAEAGTDVVLPVMMRNSIDATGFQLDLVLPEGVTLKDAALSNARTTSKRTNLFDYARQADGTYRILCNSTKGLSFNGHDGEVMILTLHIDKDAELGAQPIALKDMVLTDATGMLREESSLSESTLWVGNATGIHEMASEKGALTYDLQGRQVSKKQKGIHIQNGKKTVVK